MEGNRDESDRCMKLAEDYIKLGLTEKAKKFLHKAERLYPSKKAKDLLNQLTTDDSNKADDGSETTERGSTPSSPASSRRGSRSADCQELQPKYTQEQLDAVRKIRRCKDYYEILGVAKDCGDEDLKKAYKKLALKFHPDKNHAPGTTEAFKAIGNAFSVLSDPQKRKRYDEYGSDDTELRRRSRPNGYEYDFSRGFEGDMSAEDLFRMFFGGHVFTANHHSPRQHHRPQPQNESPYMFLLQLSPLIFIIILSLLSSLLVGQSPYSLRRDAKYSRERKTRNLGVVYWVRDDFSAGRDGTSLRQIERHVEEDYIVELQHGCYRERNNREAAMWRAQM